MVLGSNHLLPLCSQHDTLIGQEVEYRITGFTVLFVDCMYPPNFLDVFIFFERMRGFGEKKCLITAER